MDSPPFPPHPSYPHLTALEYYHLKRDYDIKTGRVKPGIDPNNRTRCGRARRSTERDS